MQYFWKSTFHLHFECLISDPLRWCTEVTLWKLSYCPNGFHLTSWNMVCKANIQFISLLQTQPACRQSMQCDSTMVRVLGQLLQQSLCRSGRAVDSLLTCWVNEECWGHLWGSLSKLEEAHFDWLRIGEYTNFCWNMTNSLTCLRVEPVCDHFIL